MGMGDPSSGGYTTSVYLTKPTHVGQLSLALNRVPALIGWGKGGNVASAGWHIPQCDRTWHASSRSGEGSELAIRGYFNCTFLPPTAVLCCRLAPWTVDCASVP